MLWIFIDILTDRILHMEYLITADSKALSKIIKKKSKINMMSQSRQ
ncbi:MAG: hypothetical protein ACTSWG_06035 [Candidatus Helarchaeota archaeon]